MAERQNSPNKPPELDIIIPVYNEGENIINVLESLQQSVKTSIRIFICYDQVYDTTLDALKHYKKLAAMNITLVKNTGQGVLEAIKSGITKSTTSAIMIYTADDTFNAGIVDSMYQQFMDGSQIVAASRFIPGGCMKNCPFPKSILVTTAAFLLHRFAGMPTHDPTNGFRLFSRKVLQEIPIESSEGWAFSLELLVKCHKKGWKITEVPARWFERQRGQSRFEVLGWLPLYLRWFFYAFAK